MAAPVAAAHALLDALAGATDTLPVTSRWHGDLTWWNRARDDAGQLWVWDWESSEEDAVAGLDALHWAFSARRTTSAVRASSTSVPVWPTPDHT